jgi:hypothetical protein
MKSKEKNIKVKKIVIKRMKIKSNTKKIEDEIIKK